VERSGSIFKKTNLVSYKSDGVGASFYQYSTALFFTIWVKKQYCNGSCFYSNNWFRR